MLWNSLVSDLSNSVEAHCYSQSQSDAAAAADVPIELLQKQTSEMGNKTEGNIKEFC